MSKTQLKISLKEYYNAYKNDVQGLMKLTYLGDVFTFILTASFPLNRG
jgi:hypothetical protein